MFVFSSWRQMQEYSWVLLLTLRNVCGVLVSLNECLQLTLRKSVVLNIDCGKVLGSASFSFLNLMFKESFIPCATLDCSH